VVAIRHPGGSRARFNGQSLSDLEGVIYVVCVPRPHQQKPGALVIFTPAPRLLLGFPTQPAGVDRRWRQSAAANSKVR